MFQTTEGLLISARKLHTKFSAILLTLRKSRRQSEVLVLQQNRPFCFTSRTFFGIAVGLAMGSTVTLADDTQLTRACDVAAANNTDTLRPPGIAGVSDSGMDVAAALAACQSAVAASPGNLRLLSELAHVYRVMKQDDKARELNLKAADQGYADAQWRVGFYYQNGEIGLPKNETEAARYYKLAAAQGHPLGQAFLGGLYLRGAGGLPLNAVEAARLLKLAADQGLPIAQYSLGILYEKGVGVPRDLAQAASAYRKAADQGNADAQNNLGFMYENGRGVPKDDTEAAGWFRKAAEQGNATGQFKLGVMYRTGSGGLPQNDHEAVRLYGLAADQGNADAQYNLGVLYSKGVGGLPQDDGEAVRLFRLAADQGNADAQNNLGFMYENGRGVDQDERLAEYWLSKAAKQGQAEAKNAMAQLEAQSQQTGTSGVTRQQLGTIQTACALWAYGKARAHNNDPDDKLMRRWGDFCVSQMLKGIPCALFEAQYKAQCSALPRE
jgi:TPR repeat protein